MLHLIKELHNPVCSWNQCLAPLGDTRENTCFFDIETTGFSGKVASCYLIGAASMQNGKMELHQWFADDYHSEKDLLTSFFDYLKNFRSLVHFNGDRFDIPFLEDRCRFLKIPCGFEHLRSIDLIKDLRPLKNFLGLENCKLKTAESLLGFKRRDTFSGGDCIQLYSDFMQKKVYRDDSHKDCLDKLLLHNEDDLVGTILATQILAYKALSFGQISWNKTDTTLVLRADLKQNIPLTTDQAKDFISLHLDQDQISIGITLYMGCLKHYFPDYKNYYYLPEEDVAIHKSVASFVDSKHRVKAKKENCYLKKEGS
ncbi:MAG: ribonuclease H-like domain-containing protein, partial [Eubacterium sp.]|nr:ribonuclease H-like domain-containing protein [Eubacterium sp.]